MSLWIPRKNTYQEAYLGLILTLIDKQYARVNVSIKLG